MYKAPLKCTNESGLTIDTSSKEIVIMDKTFGNWARNLCNMIVGYGCQFCFNVKHTF